METCLYHSKTICSYDLKTTDGIYKEELVDQYKLAASRRELRCADCNEPVYLAAGPIKEPYFAHFDEKSCPYSNFTESETCKAGKRILYQMLQSSYPDVEISARHRFGNGLYCTAYADIKEGLAIDFRLGNLSYASFDERNQFYEQHQMIKYYILGSPKTIHITASTNRQYVWYLGQIQKAQGFCILFSVDKKEFTIYKRIRYSNKRRLICFEEYLFTDDISHFSFDLEGTLCYTKDKVTQTVKQMVDDYEEKLKKAHAKTNVLPFDGLNEIALENSIRHIRNGHPELVSERYRSYIYEHHPELCPREET